MDIKSINILESELIYMEEYVITGDHHRAHVKGSLKDDGLVKVRYDNEVYEFHSEREGTFKKRAASAELNCSDGSYVKERPITQEIKLPNGVKIESDAKEHKMVLPSGKQITNKNCDNATVIKEGSVKINIQKKKSSSSLSTDLDMTVLNNKNSYEKSRKSNDKKDKESYMVSNENLIESLTPSVLTLGIILYGIFTSAQSVIMLGLFIYLLLSIPTLIKYILERTLRFNKNRTNEATEESENNIDEIKNMYANGKIDESELEEKLEKELYDHKEVEVETN
jgi:uncharacterized membrane protein